MSLLSTPPSIEKSITTSPSSSLDVMQSSSTVVPKRRSLTRRTSSSQALDSSNDALSILSSVSNGGQLRSSTRDKVCHIQILDEFGIEGGDFRVSIGESDEHMDLLENQMIEFCSFLRDNDDAWKFHITFSSSGTATVVDCTCILGTMQCLLDLSAAACNDDEDDDSLRRCYGDTSERSKFIELFSCSTDQTQLQPESQLTNEKYDV